MAGWTHSGNYCKACDKYCSDEDYCESCKEHIGVCNTCGEEYDRRDLSAVAKHEHRGLKVYTENFGVKK